MSQAVEIRMNSFDGETMKGKVLRADDTWIEIATKKKIELVNIAAIRKITVRS